MKILPTLLVAASLLAPGAVFAQASDADAVGAYKRGRALLAQHKPTEALTELKASAAQLPSPNTELLIGHALRELERFGEAMETYERVLGDASAKVQAGEKRYQRTLEEAGRWSAALRPKVGRLAIVLEGDDGTAEVVAAGRSIAVSGGARKAWFAAGQVSVEASASDGRTATGEASVPAGGGEVSLTLSLPVVTELVEPTLPVEPEPIDEGEGFPLPPWPVYAAGGVGVVGFVLFGAFGSMSASTASDLDACAPSCPEDLRADADAGKRNQLIANVGLGIGIAGIAAAATIWTLDIVLDDDDEHVAEAWRVQVGPTGARLMTRF
jgi:hypothetical protein